MGLRFSWLPRAGACCSNFFATIHYYLLNNNDLQSINLPSQRFTSFLKDKGFEPNYIGRILCFWQNCFYPSYWHAHLVFTCMSSQKQSSLWPGGEHSLNLYFALLIVYEHNCAKTRMKIHRNIITRISQNRLALN